MAKLYANRGAQYVKSSEFIFNWNDTAIDSVALTLKSFGSTFGDAIVFDCINLPVGAQILSGDLVVETAGVGPTVYTAKLGVAGNDAIYLAASDLKAAANTRYALLATSNLGSLTGLNVRMTIASTAANATAGRARVTIVWKLDGQQNEVIPQ